MEMTTVTFERLPVGALFQVKGVATLYRKAAADEIRFHGLPASSWLSRHRTRPIPNLLVIPVNSTRVEPCYETSVEADKPQQNVTAKRTVPKRAKKVRSIPRRS